MKIIARTPTELIVRESAMTLRLLGAFLMALGTFAIYAGTTQDAEGSVSVFPTTIGSFLALAGLSLALFPALRLFAFDKAEHVCRIVTQRLSRVDRQTIPLRDIADVTLEESRSTESGSTYRLAMRLSDRRSVPWTPYYTSGYATKKAVLDSVRDFLGFTPSVSLGSSATPATRERHARRARFGMGAMAAFCGIFLVVGIVMLAKEQRRLTTFEPVTATVLSVRVDAHTDSDGSTYEPVVTYRYRVGGSEYTSAHVTPLRESRSGGWAYRVIDRFQIGSEYTAFYDPENPADAYLLRSRSVVPWAFVGISVIAILLIGVGIRSNTDQG